MTPATASLLRRLLAGTLIMLAAWVTMVSWQVLTLEYVEVSMNLLGIGIAVVGGGALMRWRHTPNVVVVIGQIVLAAAIVLKTITDSFLPTLETLEAFRLAIEGSVESAQRFMAPVPTGENSVHPLLLVAGAIVMVSIDVCAGTLRRVPLAGLILLAAYSVPAAVTADSGSLAVFVVAGGLFLAALFIQQSDDLAGWGQAPEDSSGDLSIRSGSVAVPAVALGAAALAMGALVPTALPTLDASRIKGSGPGSGAVTVRDPTVDLRRDLQRGEDVALLNLTTPGPRPSYLRMSVLTTFVNGSWTPGDREIPEDQTAMGTLPALDGVSPALPRTSSRYSVQVEDELDATWLPTLPQISQIRASDQWRYDVATRDFISVREGITTSGLRYEFTGIELTYDPALLDAASSGRTTVRSVFTDVPADLDPRITDLATRVTASAPTRFQKMQLLQRWFREDGGFTYDLSAVDSLGEADADLMAFLDVSGRSGYCEQFAAAMALMARTLGVPSRVAVGFLEPESIGHNRWQFSAWDLHAWPELYFPGSGWVRFEPTPSARAEQPPGYTTVDVREDPTTPSPSVQPSTEADPEPNRNPADATTETADTDEPSGVRRDLVVAVLGVFGLLLALLAPQWRRRSLRSRRLRSGVEGVWSELRALSIDLGHSWPEGLSPRRSGAFLAQQLATRGERRGRVEPDRRGPLEAPEAVRALERIVERLERSRYARTSEPGANEPQGTSLTHDFELVADALSAGVSTRAERRARWWPRTAVSEPWRLAGSSRRRDHTASATSVTGPESSEKLVG